MANQEGRISEMEEQLRSTQELLMEKMQRNKEELREEFHKSIDSFRGAMVEELRSTFRINTVDQGKAVVGDGDREERSVADGRDRERRAVAGGRDRDDGEPSSPFARDDGESSSPFAGDDGEPSSPFARDDGKPSSPFAAGVVSNRGILSSPKRGSNASVRDLINLGVTNEPLELVDGVDVVPTKGIEKMLPVSLDSVHFKGGTLLLLVYGDREPREKMENVYGHLKFQNHYGRVYVQLSSNCKMWRSNAISENGGWLSADVFVDSVKQKWHANIKIAKLFAPLLERILEIPIAWFKGRATDEVHICMSRRETFPNLHGQLDAIGLAFQIFDAPSSFSDISASLCFRGQWIFLHNTSGWFGHVPLEDYVVCRKFSDLFLLILEELVSFACISCSIFWVCAVEDTTLSGAVRGKLGGPSQCRLSSSTTAAMLEAITSTRAIASVTSWCAQFKGDVQLKFTWTFMWKFFWKTVSSSISGYESGAEVCVAAYEALAPILRALVSSFSLQALDLIRENDKSSSSAEVGGLVQTRRAILLNWKWQCLESLLSSPCYTLEKEFLLKNNISFFSHAVIRCIFSDLVESLQNAGKGSVLPMLRSIRLTLSLLASGKSDSLVSSCNVIDAQMMWNLVCSSSILHVSNSKQRVVSIAALLSSILHTFVFANEGMHLIDNGLGPLKWSVENVLEEGTKSPRTVCLTALHLTGLCLSHPRIITYYIKELKLLTPYGSVAFDEDYEAELTKNRDARTKVSLLAKSSDPELTEAFIITELYARVSVAVLFYKLFDLVATNENEDCCAALESGKLFLLELNDKDLTKELYKKYSGIHRRKIRAWQMICVLSRFVDDDTVGKVTSILHIALYRNNLPVARQYLETFEISIYLKFPSLVRVQLVLILRDYEMRPQALSSYVFITAIIILHAYKAFQARHLDKLLPPFYLEKKLLGHTKVSIAASSLISSLLGDKKTLMGRVLSYIGETENRNG